MAGDTATNDDRRSPTRRRRRHRPAPVGISARDAAAGAALLVGAALVAASALIHLYLWADGYRNIATIGPLFLVQGMTGLAVAVLLVAYPRLAAAGVGISYLGATALAFAVSATQGLFGFMDKLDAPWAGTSLVIECAGIVLLAAGGALSWLSTQPRTQAVEIRPSRQVQR